MQFERNWHGTLERINWCGEPGESDVSIFKLILNVFAPWLESDLPECEYFALNMPCHTRIAVDLDFGEYVPLYPWFTGGVRRSIFIYINYSQFNQELALTVRMPSSQPCMEVKIRISYSHDATVYTP